MKYIIRIKLMDEISENITLDGTTLLKVDIPISITRKAGNIQLTKPDYLFLFPQFS